MRETLTAVACLFLSCTASLVAHIQTPRPVSPQNIHALVQAIQDEIYDEGCQGYGYDASGSANGTKYELPLYVKPTWNGSGDSWAIYKFLPIGEVLRMFSNRSDGLVELAGHPEWNFPPTDPSYLTVFMDDNELCRMKHDWIRTTLSLDTNPPVDVVLESIKRQKLRFGDNYVKHKRDCSFSWR